MDHLYTYEGYRQWLAFAQTHRVVVPFRDWNSSKQLILRHDVDLDVLPAYRLMQIETECGVRSTYFFLTTSPHYNVRAHVNQLRLSEMVQRGFEIGLHFDPTLYQADDDLTACVNREVRLLSEAVGVSVNSVSLHNPSLGGRYPLFDGYRNAYDPQIFMPDRYISDSRMNLTQENLEKFITAAGDVPLQVLLHPLHFTNHGATYLDIMTQFLAQQAEMLQRTFQVNSTFADQLRATGFDLVDYVRREE